MSPKKPFSPTRRRALQGLGAAALAGGAACEPTDEAPRTDGTLEEAIDTVVFLMMENRTFDHYFGAYSLVEGRADVDGLTEDMSNPTRDGTPVFVHPADRDCIPDPPHGWADTHTQWGDGANDGFVREHEDRHGPDEAHRVMGFWDREMLPASYALADEYALCQRWFCSVLSSTWPNRFYSLMASSFGEHGNDPPDFGGAPSIFDRLHDAGIPYGGYFGNVGFAGLVPDARANGTFEEMDFFWGHAERGILPPATVIDPIFGRNDDHPPAHPLAGQVLINSVYRALAASPQWERMLLVITYDEHGGFFDHVPPPETADPYAEFTRMGFRVPTVVAGPYVKQMVSDTVYDHTSWLAFLERRFGLEPLNERDAAANDLTDLLDWDRIAALDPRPPLDLPVIEADDDVLYRPECSSIGGGGRDLAPVTGQPELEAYLDALPERPDWDQRHRTDAIYEQFLRRAEALGALKRR